MRDSRSTPFRLAAVLPAVVVLLATATLARADLLIFSDGFTIHGKLREERTLVTDSFSKESWVLPKGVYIDAGARRVFFGYGQVPEADRTFSHVDDAVGTGRKIVVAQPHGIPIVVGVVNSGAFDEKWDRVFVYRTVGRDVRVPQHIMELTSSHVRVDATKDFIWSAFYLTQELGCEQVRKLLTDHPSFHDPVALAPAKRAERRFRLYHFLVHAGWYNEAGDELDGILRDLPKEKKKVEEERERLNKLHVQRHFESIQRGHRAGRYQWVLEQIADFREQHATQKAIDEVRSIKRTHAEKVKMMDEAREYLAALLKRVRGEEEALFSEAVKAIRAELHHDTVGRLDDFLEQARQAARQEKNKGKADRTPSELLALAVTGWLRGVPTEERVETARKLWTARKMVLAYLKAENDTERKNALAEFSSAKNALSIDEVAQIISLLPPPLAEKKPPTKMAEQKIGRISYLLKLPPEYHHGRSYPLLIVLHNAGERTQSVLERYADKAKEEGYILVAPNWSRGGIGGDYTYSAEEHAVVLETLRDLRLRFNVDSNRVFLSGLGQGGDMAYDVGLSHPDLFAGVLPMSADPKYFITRYWANAQYLPFYIVGGSHTGDPDKTTRRLFEKWIPHDYRALYVQYKGRGREWFGGELPYMFDWMNRKRRSAPTTHLGRIGGPELGDEFASMRETDNRFYWLSGTISPHHINSFSRWRNTTHPARLVGRLDPGTNQLFLYPSGYQRISVWLARDAKIDFDKPLKVWINGARAGGDQKVRPSLTVLLDDFAARGDRQKLFISRFDFKP